MLTLRLGQLLALLLIFSTYSGFAGITVYLSSGSPSPAWAGSSFSAQLTITGQQQYEYSYSVTASLSGPGGGSYTFDANSSTYNISSEASGRGDITLTVTVTGTPLPESGATGQDNGTASITFTIADVASLTPTSEYALTGTVLTFTATTDPAGIVPEDVPWAVNGGGTVEGNSLTGVFTADSSIIGAGTVTVSCTGATAHTANVQEIVLVTQTPRQTEEGTSAGTFTVTPSATPAGISYAWEFSNPTPAGNGPSVPFASPSAASTGLGSVARWFAYPDVNWWRTGMETCVYSITCKVSYKGGEQYSPWDTWSVNAKPEGSTTWPAITGFPTTGTDLINGQTIYKVTGVGTLTRTIPVSTIDCAPTSQFKAKVEAHEGRHVTQLTAMSPWKDMRSADALYNDTLSAYTADTLEELNTMIALAIANANTVGGNDLAATRPAREEDAFAFDRLVAPHYLERYE